MEYFYTLPRCISSESLTIEGDEFSHLTHVMRKKVGDHIRVVDGIGNAYDVTIADISQRTASCSIASHYARLHEPKVDVTLAVALLKNSSNYEFLVEKCTELGVSSFVPLITERTIARHAKTERLRKIALAAMKQCGRCVLPTIHETIGLQQFISQSHQGLKLIPHEKGETPGLRAALHAREYASAIICIGPEGGFTDEEVALAIQSGFDPVGLGTRRLRTETAAIVSASFVVT